MKSLRDIVGWIRLLSRNPSAVCTKGGLRQEANPPYKFRSFPHPAGSTLGVRKRESSRISYWIPAVAGMSGVLLFGCSNQHIPAEKALVCNHELSGYETMPITVRLLEEVLPESINKKAEVSYGVHPLSATYLETNERYTVTLPKNDTFPECIITIDRLSGFAKHLCLGKSNAYPNDPRSETFELSCKNKEEKL